MLVVVDNRWGHWSKLVRVGPVEAGAILGLVSFAIAVKLLTVLSTVI